MRLFCASSNLFTYFATVSLWLLLVGDAPAQTSKTATTSPSTAMSAYIITTVAGSGVSGYGGDGGPATNAELDSPVDVALDGSGNLYISDSARVRRVWSTDGIITTVAGTGTVGFSGDGGPATSATLGGSIDATVDSAGNIYMNDFGNRRIRKVTSSTGVITTIATNTGLGEGIAIDGNGNVYFTNGADSVDKLAASTGIVTTVAGGNGSGFSGDGGPATKAQLLQPSSVILDSDGNLLIADRGSSRIRKVDAATGIISTIAGFSNCSGSTGGRQCPGGFSGDGGLAVNALLNDPNFLAIDSVGNIYVADTLNFRIREIDAVTGVINTIAGSGANGYSGDGGPAADAQMGAPAGLVVDNQGRVYFADESNSRIRVLTPVALSINAGGVVNAASYATTIAPGSIVASFGSFLLTSAAQSQATPLPTNLSGLSIQFVSGTNAPLFYVSGSQVNLQVPWELAGQLQVPVTVTVDGQTSPPQTANIAPFSPGIFTINGQGTGQGAILDASYHMVDPSNAAMPGSTVLQIFCTGLGAVTNQPQTGFPAPTSTPLAETRTTPTVTIGGVPASVLFSGLAPGFVGEYQVNALVPATTLAGNAVPVVITIGGVTSNTVTIAVQGPTGTGTLDIQVTGLPVGTPANVSVTSTNGYATTVTGNASLQVPSGTYSITATPVVAGNASYNAATQTVNVAPGATANAQVAYDTVIPNTTKTLDQQGIQGLTVSADGSTITLPGTSTAAQSLQPGDVLAIGITPATPGGLLRKVTSVSQSGSQVVAVTTQATLADAFQQLDFKSNAPISLQAPQGLPAGVTFHRGRRQAGMAPSAQRSTQGACTDDTAAWIEMASLPIVSDENGSITADGQLDICPGLEFDFNLSAPLFQLPKLNSLLLTATLAGDLHVTVSGEYKGTLKTQLPIKPTLQSDPVVVDVFGVPVVLAANLTFFFGASGTVNGSFSAGADNEASVTLGLSYSDGQFSPIATKTYKFTEDPIVFDASLMAQVSFGAKIDVLVDKVLTPSVSPDDFLQLNVDPSANPWWTVAGGVEISACSVALDVLGIGGELDCPDDLIQQLQLSVPIFQASGGFLPSDTTPAITSITPDSVAAGSPGVTLTVTGKNFVPGATANFSGAALQSTVVSTSQMTAMLPAGDLTTGGAFPITVTNPPPNGGTSPPFDFKVQAGNNPKPTITSLSPSSATAGSSPLTLTINGSGFIGSSAVTFNGVSHAVAFVNSGQLTITLSASDLAAAGSFPVVVSNPAPGGGSSNAVTFTVQPPVVAPTLTSLTLSATSVVGGNSVTATVSLSSPAAPGGVNVALESNNSAAMVPAPPTLPIVAGQSSATFTITTTAVTSSQTATITASLGASALSAVLTISPGGNSAVTMLSVAGDCGDQENLNYYFSFGVEWTQTSSYYDVNIDIAATTNFLSAPSDGTPVQAFLTTDFLPGATSSSQVASTSFVIPPGSPPNTLVRVFTGLTLGPSAYELTIYAPTQGSAGGWCFAFFNPPTSSSAPDVTEDFSYFLNGYATYPPAGGFLGYSDPVEFSITGTPGTPP